MKDFILNVVAGILATLIVSFAIYSWNSYLEGPFTEYWLLFLGSFVFGFCFGWLVQTLRKHYLQKKSNVISNESLARKEVNNSNSNSENKQPEPITEALTEEIDSVANKDLIESLIKDTELSEYFYYYIEPKFHDRIYCILGMLDSELKRRSIKTIEELPKSLKKDLIEKRIIEKPNYYLSSIGILYVKKMLIMIVANQVPSSG